MKTLLVLAPHPELAESLRTGLSPEQYRIVHRTTVDEAEPLLAHGLANACIVDVELSSVQGVWILEKLRRRSAKCPLIIYTGAKQWEWEEEAYLQGATYVLTKPVRMRMLTAMLDRLWETPGAPAPAPAQVAQPNYPKPAAALPAVSPQTAFQSLSPLRGFSAILTHSLDADAMLKQFLLLLRELIGINRAAVFLRQPSEWAGGQMTLDDNRRLRAACAIGLSPGLLEHFELSFETGIGGQITRLGRILRRSSDEARLDVEAQKEFELLGAQVAVPILDRETVIGVALFDGHITGETLGNPELELIFHLLEQLGLAVKNIWLHEQLSGSHTMMAEILRELSSACVVV
ncbi:MAG TPA: response regulator, partial [Candidatus Binatia bacterium]|nr:response regulator [Candidatus Binatia bacterium]